MTGIEKANQLLELIESGKTVFITNYMHSYKIDKKVVKRFGDRAVLKGTEKNLYMSSGNKYVCIDGCKITSN